MPGNSKLSVRRQCELLDVNRSNVYYESQPALITDVDLLNRIREIWERYSFYGYRRIIKELQGNGVVVNHKRVQRLMTMGGIQAIHPGPNTSKRNHRQAVHPYLLKGLVIAMPNIAWQVDITYLRMGNGFMYLVALIDVFSRYVVGWSLSNTMDTSFCIMALTMGLSQAIPEIINSDQGSQFTSDEWVKTLKDKGIKVSMTGKGRCLDNIYIERFWRSFKWEEFYLYDYQNVAELKKAIVVYIEFYNHKRRHQSLDYKTPAQIYWGGTNEGNPVNIWTSPSDQSVPCGTCGQVTDNTNVLTMA